MSPLSRTCNTLEAGRVARYHAAPSVQPQTVGLHSYGVAIILLYLTEGTASAALLQAALLHDAPEIFTGDVPFTAKRRSRNLEVELLELEEQAHNHIVLPFPNLQPSEVALLKLADTLEGLIWCRKTEHAQGPVLARWVRALEDAHAKFATVLTLEVIHRSKALADNHNFFL